MPSTRCYPSVTLSTSIIRCRCEVRDRRDCTGRAGRDANIGLSHAARAPACGGGRERRARATQASTAIRERATEPRQQRKQPPRATSDNDDLPHHRLDARLPAQPRLCGSVAHAERGPPVACASASLPSRVWRLWNCLPCGLCVSLSLRVHVRVLTIKLRSSFPRSWSCAARRWSLVRTRTPRDRDARAETRIEVVSAAAGECPGSSAPRVRGARSPDSAAQGSASGRDLIPLLILLFTIEAAPGRRGRPAADRPRRPLTRVGQPEATETGGYRPRVAPPPSARRHTGRSD